MPESCRCASASLSAIAQTQSVFAPFGGAGGFHGAFVFKRGGGGGAEVRPAGIALDSAFQA